MRQRVRCLKRESESVRSVRLALRLAFGPRIGTLIRGEVLEIGELLVDVDRGLQARAQVQDLKALLSSRVDRHFERLEIVVQGDRCSMNFFLLGAPSELHVCSDTDARLYQGHRFGLFRC